VRLVRDGASELRIELGFQVAGDVGFEVTVGEPLRFRIEPDLKPIDSEQPWPTIAERSGAAILGWRFEPAESTTNQSQGA
jgi:hypothetical protein